MVKLIVKIIDLLRNTAYDRSMFWRNKLTRAGSTPDQNQTDAYKPS
jgi:hypothetical protein